MTSNQRMAKGFGIGLAIFLLVTIGSVILGVVFGISGGVGNVFPGSAETVDFAADFEDVESVSVISGMAKLNIKSGDSFRVEAWGVPEYFKAEMSGRVLMVDIGGSQNWFTGIFNGFHDYDSMRIDVTLPENFSAKNIFIDTGSGGGDVANLKASAIEIDSGSGRFAGIGLEADNISIDSGSGSCRIEDLNARTLSFDGGSGSVDIMRSKAENVRLDFASGGGTVTEADFFGLKLDTSSGRVSLDGLVTGDVSINSGSGNVVLNIGSRQEDYRFDFDSGSGGIWLNGNKYDDYQDGDSQRPYKFNIDGGSGRVTIDFLR